MRKSVLLVLFVVLLLCIQVSSHPHLKEMKRCSKPMCSRRRKNQCGCNGCCWATGCKRGRCRGKKCMCSKCPKVPPTTTTTTMMSSTTSSADADETTTMYP